MLIENQFPKAQAERLVFRWVFNLMCWATIQASAGLTGRVGSFDGWLTEFEVSAKG